SNYYFQDANFMSMGEQNGKVTAPAHKQEKQPGIESKMKPEPEYVDANYEGSNKLKVKVAMITGEDRGIGCEVSINFEKEGCDAANLYYDEHDDSTHTKRIVEQTGQKCTLISGDIGSQSFCESAAAQVLEEFGKIDILVNNASEQHPQDSFMDIT